MKILARPLPKGRATPPRDHSGGRGRPSFTPSAHRGPQTAAASLWASSFIRSSPSLPAQSSAHPASTRSWQGNDSNHQQGHECPVGHTPPAIAGLWGLLDHLVPAGQAGVRASWPQPPSGGPVRCLKRGALGQSRALVRASAPFNATTTQAPSRHRPTGLNQVHSPQGSFPPGRGLP